MSYQGIVATLTIGGMIAAIAPGCGATQNSAAGIRGEHVDADPDLMGRPRPAGRVAIRSHGFVGAAQTV
jgi:hypothetical protein